MWNTYVPHGVSLKMPHISSLSNDTHSWLMLRVRAIYYVLVDSAVLKYVGALLWADSVFLTYSNESQQLSFWVSVRKGAVLAAAPAQRLTTDLH